MKSRTPSTKHKRKTKIDHHDDLDDFTFIDPIALASTAAAPVIPQELINISEWHVEKDRVSTSSTLASSIPSKLLAYTDHAEPMPFQPDLDINYQAFDIDPPENLVKPTNKQQSKESNTGDPAIHAWIKQVGIYLSEFFRLEARCQTRPVCVCGGDAPVYRCQDCLGGSLVCVSCIARDHKSNPFHKIKRWNRTFFERTSLKSLGFRIQLGHPASESCLLPLAAAGDSFIIIDVTGIHEVGLDFCGCGTGSTEIQQLLQFRLYPATVQSPNTAATFKALHQFQILNFESKCSVYEYYQTLVRQTDNTGVIRVRDCYKSLLRMIRQWRHLRMLKRSQHEGDQSWFGLLCPACPQPGINLPADWDKAPEDRSWLYRLFVALDANFRMSRKGVSSTERDPCLTRGRGYFVDNEGLSAHLEAHEGHRQEPSTCVSHQAVNTADTREARGLAVTGVGTVDCACHDMKRPNSLGDLQKGERYVNMDYFFYSGLKDTAIKSIVVSYDIACQWYKNFSSRMSNAFPDWHVNTPDVDLEFLVPKFHLTAHIPQCRRDFSFNFTKHVGRTDGEAPERGWSNINALAYSTQEMGPGSRQDTIEDHLGNWNWKKITGMGSSLLRKIKMAIPQKAKQTQAWKDLSSALELEMVAAWTSEVESWEADFYQPNPYEPRLTHLSEADVCLQFAQEDAQEIRTTTGLAVPDIGPGGMIHQGLELEDLQFKILIEEQSLGLHATALQQAQHQECKNTFFRKVASWHDAQIHYVPTVLALRTPGDLHELDANKVELLLPSAIGNKVAWDRDLGEYEWRLRLAQANDSLNEIQQSLAIKDFLWKRKKAHSRGVRQNLRSQAEIDKVIKKTHTSATKYRTARTALGTLATLLAKGDSWRQEIQQLKDEDIRALPVDGLGEGTRTLSWIWKGSGTAPLNANEPQMLDALRIQWCRARACAMRWSEEVELLREEMQRVLAYLAWDVDMWAGQAGVPGKYEDSWASEGLNAYAARQAHLRWALLHHFEKLWKDVGTWYSAGDVPEGENESKVTSS